MESGSTTAKYVRGLNYIAKVGVTNGTSYYLYNGHNDVVQMVSASGSIQNQYDYDVFGETLLNIETTENAIKFAGEFYDAEAGLYYQRSRYYNPATGRFISEDSYRGDVNDPSSLNLYTYCKNDPVNFIDPSGHAPEPTYKVPGAPGPNYDGTPYWHMSDSYKKSMGSTSSYNPQIYLDSLAMRNVSERFSLVVTNLSSMGESAKDKIANAEIACKQGLISMQKYMEIIKQNGGTLSEIDLGMEELDLVEVFNAEDLSVVKVANYTLSSQTGSGRVYTADMKVELIDAKTGEFFNLKASEAARYVQEGSAYTLLQEVPDNIRANWLLIESFKRIDIDPFEIVEFDGVKKTYLQLVLEDMPYFEVMSGERSSTPNNAVKALAKIFRGLGMDVPDHGIFDDFDMRGAVDAIMGGFYSNSKTDPNFYSQLRTYILLAGMVEDESVVQSLREGLGNNAKYYANSMRQGQRNYEEAKRREAILREQVLRQQRAAIQARNAANSQGEVYGPPRPPESGTYGDIRDYLLPYQLNERRTKPEDYGFYPWIKIIAQPQNVSNTSTFVPYDVSGDTATDLLGGVLNSMPVVLYMQGLLGYDLNGTRLTDEQRVEYLEYGMNASANAVMSAYITSGIKNVGTPPALYRGGKGFKVRDRDIIYNEDGTLVLPKNGVSVNSSSDKVKNFGGAYEVKSLPKGLHIEHTGGTHYEIVPDEPMTKQEYETLLNLIELIPID